MSSLQRLRLQQLLQATLATLVLSNSRLRLSAIRAREFNLAM
jgi:hypothetical protein